MTIPEAIDRNVELKGELIREGRLEKADALQLGIEALKAFMVYRSRQPVNLQFLLPGETED
ncbi:hypothetical protein ES708_07999 [subsurface metagenome]